jgi:hypothetical protein
MVSAVGVWGGVEHKGRLRRESDLSVKRWVRSRSFTSLEVQIRDYGWSNRVAKPIKRRSLAGCDREWRPWADIEAPMRGGEKTFGFKPNCRPQGGERGKCHHEGSGRNFSHDEITALISMEPDPRAFFANQYTKALLVTGKLIPKRDGKGGERQGDLKAIRG